MLGKEVANMLAQISTSGFEKSENIFLLHENLLRIDPDAANKLRRNYILNVHRQAIGQMKNASGRKKDMWKTYIWINGSRKEILGHTEDELIDKLFNKYASCTSSSLREIFELLMDDKAKKNLSFKTIYENQRIFNKLSKELQETPICLITDSMLKSWIQEKYLLTLPSKNEIKKLFNILNQTFNLGIKVKKCNESPMRFLDIHDYYRSCRKTEKAPENKSFSTDEVTRLVEYGREHADNPRALIMLLSAATGLRGGELVALHKEDILPCEIHVHRQQVKTIDKNGHTILIEVPYTKNERLAPRNGRYIPINEDVRFVIDKALLLEPDSDYLFSKNGIPISKDSYFKYLNRVCGKLGIDKTNNHAFRMAFNAELDREGFDLFSRATLLGHSVDTNHRFYSLTDSRRRKELYEKRTGMKYTDSLSSLHNYIA